MGDITIARIYHNGPRDYFRNKLNMALISLEISNIPNIQFISNDSIRFNFEWLIFRSTFVLNHQIWCKLTCWNLWLTEIDCCAALVILLRRMANSSKNLTSFWNLLVGHKDYSYKTHSKDPFNHRIKTFFLIFSHVYFSCFFIFPHLHVIARYN